MDMLDYYNLRSGMYVPLLVLRDVSFCPQASHGGDVSGCKKMEREDGKRTSTVQRHSSLVSGHHKEGCVSLV